MLILLAFAIDIKLQNRNILPEVGYSIYIYEYKKCKYKYKIQVKSFVMIWYGPTWTTVMLLNTQSVVCGQINIMWRLFLHAKGYNTHTKSVTFFAHILFWKSLKLRFLVVRSLRIIKMLVNLERGRCDKCS